jgi:hypothetical protein
VNEDFLSSILSQDSTAEANAEAEPAETKVEEEAPASVTTEETKTEEAAPADETVGTAKEEPRVPVAALVEERTKRQEIERQLEEYREREAAATTQQKASVPDPIDDPEGFRRAVLLEAQQAVINDRFARNHEEAVEKHGDEKVSAAKQWAAQRAATDKAFEANVFAASRPIELIVREHERAARLAEFESMDEREFLLKRAAELGLNLAPTTEAVVGEATKPDVAKTQPQPPKSLVNATSSTKANTQTNSDFSIGDILNLR